MAAVVVIMHDRCRKRDSCHSNQDSNNAGKIHDILVHDAAGKNMKKKSFSLFTLLNYCLCPCPFPVFTNPSCTFSQLLTSVGFFSIFK